MQAALEQEQEQGRGMIRAAVFVLLWVGSLASGLAVVYSTYAARLQVQELESLRREAIALKVSGGQYRLELSSLASYPRIESLARSRLQMTAPEPGKTVLISPTASQLDK